MTASTVFLLLLVVACPLMMIWMMRSGHGGDGHTGHGENHDHGDRTAPVTSAELRRRRDELDRLIEERGEEELKERPSVRLR